MTLKRKLAATLVAGIVSVFGIACGDADNGDDFDDDPILDETPGEQFTPNEPIDPVDPTDDGGLTP